LLGDACLPAAEVFQCAGFRALAAHSIDDPAARFYAKYGFDPVPDSSPTLMVLAARLLSLAADGIPATATIEA
jgi:hypothetical protein